MNTILQLAQAWLEHCREASDECFDNGEDDTGQKWLSDAEEAEAIIKRHIDTGGLSEDDPRANPDLARRLAE